MKKRVIVYDDYNGTVSVSCNDDTEGIMMGTITQNIGVTAKRNGYKLIEIIQYEEGNLRNGSVKGQKRKGD